MPQFSSDVHQDKTRHNSIWTVNESSHYVHNLQTHTSDKIRSKNIHHFIIHKKYSLFFESCNMLHTLLTCVYRILDLLQHKKKFLAFNNILRKISNIPSYFTTVGYLLHCFQMKILQDPVRDSKMLPSFRKYYKISRSVLVSNWCPEYDLWYAGLWIFSSSFAATSSFSLVSSPFGDRPWFSICPSWTLSPASACL